MLAKFHVSCKPSCPAPLYGHPAHVSTSSFVRPETCATSIGKLVLTGLPDSDDRRHLSTVQTDIVIEYLNAGSGGQTKAELWAVAEPPVGMDSAVAEPSPSLDCTPDPGPGHMLHILRV